MATCYYSVPDKNTSGDNLYGSNICYQPFVDWAWDAFDFDSDYWQDGWGFDDPCNTDKPLARILNAIWLLAYSAEDYWNEDWSNDILHWGCRYVRNQMDDLQAHCGDGSANAATITGPFTDDRIEVYLPFFYEENVPARAGTLMHEARHMGGKPHNANFPPWSAYGPGRSGADSSWEYNGAFMYEALYLWWFYAAGSRTTSALRQSAKQGAQFEIDNAFATHPGIVIV
jgi:hypothetical protein